MTEALQLIAVWGSGITAGVFVAVAISVAPAMLTMPAGRYIEAHRLLGKGYHPTMPILVNITTLATLTLAILAPTAVVTLLYAAATVLLVGVQAVSHLGNVPINRQVKGVDAEHVPPDWEDPRRLWRNWHLLRTGLALCVLVLNTTAVVVVG